MTYYLEDFEVGIGGEVGSRTISREEILEFAKKFDPQPFHVDEDAARRSPFGGLIASGWHTTALCHSLLVEEYLGDGSGTLGSPGVDELRWLKPVRPEDTLTVSTEVLEVTPSRSNSGGLVKLRCVVRNQDGKDVMTMVANSFFRRRAAAREQRAVL